MPALADLAWPRTTERLSIRPLRDQDADAIWAFRSRDDVQRWLGGLPADRDDFIEQLFRPERRATTLVVELGGQVVGDLMLKVEDGWGQRDVAEGAVATQGELGWVLDPAHRGRGLATEAVRELVAVALAPAPESLGLRRVTAGCFAANESSWRLMERVGLRREQHGVRDSLHRDLGWVDGYYYALLADEWSAMSVRA